MKSKQNSFKTFVSAKTKCSGRHAGVICFSRKKIVSKLCWKCFVSVPFYCVNSLMCIQACLQWMTLGHFYQWPCSSSWLTQWTEQCIFQEIVNILFVFDYWELLLLILVMLYHWLNWFVNNLRRSCLIHHRTWGLDLGPVQASVRIAWCWQKMHRCAYCCWISVNKYAVVSTFSGKPGPVGDSKVVRETSKRTEMSGKIWRKFVVFSLSCDYCIESIIWSCTDYCG